MRPHCFVLPALLLCAVNLTAQADSILALPPGERLVALYNWNYLESKRDPQHNQQR